MVAPSRSAKKSEEDHEYEDDESPIKRLTKSAMIKTKYDQSQPVVSEYPVIVYATTSSSASGKRESSLSQARGSKKSRTSLDKNDVISTDFYSFESARDSTEDSYHTANEDELKPQILKRLEQVTVMEGESAILESKIDGKPEPIISWYKGNSNIQDSPNYIHLKEADHTYKLVIREANVRDSGVYKVVATNQYGQAICSCKLVVNEDLTDHEDMTVIDNLEGNRTDNTDNDVFDEEDNLHISEDSPTSPMSSNELDPVKNLRSIPVTIKSTTTPIPIVFKGAKPNFLKLFDSTKVKENSALLLACQAVGEPMPEIIW